MSDKNHNATVGQYAPCMGNFGEQIAIEFKISGGEYDGQSFTWFGGFSDDDAGGKTRRERTYDTLKVLGWPGDDLSDLSMIKGKPARIVLETKEKNGKTFTNVKYVNAAGGLAVKRENIISGAEWKRFANKMKAADGGAPKKPADGDDDLPF
jgi:hypothetical protein